MRRRTFVPACFISRASYDSASQSHSTAQNWNYARKRFEGRLPNHRSLVALHKTCVYSQDGVKWGAPESVLVFPELYR
jgi:hypothetical protein